MRVGVVGGGFLALVVGVFATSIGFAGQQNCSVSGSRLFFPFGYSLALGCTGYDAIVLLGIAGLFAGCALILWGALATDEDTPPDTPEDARRRKSGPLVHSIGMGGTTPGEAPGNRPGPQRARPRPRPAAGAPPKAATGGSSPPFEERACPSCGFSNLLASSVCARCGKPLPELP